MSKGILIVPFLGAALLCLFGCQTTTDRYSDEEALAIFLRDMIPAGTTKEMVQYFLNSNGYEFSYYDGIGPAPLSTGWESEERRFEGIIRDVRKAQWVSESIIFKIYLDKNDRVREIETHRAHTGT